jgi:hypothetical protein
MSLPRTTSSGEAAAPPRAKTFGHPGTKGSQRLGMARIDLHPPQRSHCSERFDMPFGLPAGAKHTRHLASESGQPARRNARRRAGTHHAQAIGLDHRAQTASLTPDTDAPGSAHPSGCWCRPCTRWRRVAAKRPAGYAGSSWQARPLPGHIAGLPRREIAVRSLDRLQHQRHGQQLSNILFTQKQGILASNGESNDQHAVLAAVRQVPRSWPPSTRIMTILPAIGVQQGPNKKGRPQSALFATTSTRHTGLKSAP